MCQIDLAGYCVGWNPLSRPDRINRASRSLHGRAARHRLYRPAIETGASVHRPRGEHSLVSGRFVRSFDILQLCQFP